MRASNVKTTWAQGGAIVNGWCSIPSSVSAEIMAHQGWDSLTVDTEHGMLDFHVAITMLHFYRK